MEKGTIVEYIEQEKLLCGVVLETNLSGNRRLRVLTENSREVNLPERRVTYAGGRLDPGAGRSELSETLKQTARRRAKLAATIEVTELWEVLVGESEWVSLTTMTALCFPGQDSPDHEAAVIRALFTDRLYFKFDHRRFFPHTEEEVKSIVVRREKEARRQRLITQGAKWLQQAVDSERPALPENGQEILEILRSYYLFEKEASEAPLAKGMLTQAGNISPDRIFTLLVRLGVWASDENLDFYRYETSLVWPPETEDRVAELTAIFPEIAGNGHRRDLTGLSLFTIDGSATLDFDDALSLEFSEDDTCRVGIHISDVAAWLVPGDLLDSEALARGSSIYTADRKVPMLPESLSEGLCSLVAGEDRPAISTLITYSPAAEELKCEIVPSLIRVTRHLTYTDVDRALGQPEQEMPGLGPEQGEQLQRLHQLAGRLREKRAAAGAVTIAIPEMDIRVDAGGRVSLRIVDRYSRARSLVEELMIAANHAAARFLTEREVPGVYRSQPEPRQRLVKKEEAPGTLFQNWVQRKMLPRVILDRKPERHAGLGVDMYTTATSPIRKYLDLITQRQIRAALGLSRAYTEGEIDDLLQRLGPLLAQVGRIQQGRQRYWILKYLEGKTGEKVAGLVLDKFKSEYSVLLPDYLLECRLARATGVNLKPRDEVQLTIQHVSARNDLISVHFG